MIVSAKHISRSALVVLLLTLTSSLFAQEKDMVRADAWTELTSQDGISIEYQFVDCDLERNIKHEWVLLRVTNTTSVAKEVSYDFHLWYNDKCTTCDKEDEYHQTITVPANGSLEGQCSFSDDRALHIISRMLNVPGSKDELTRFELANLTINSK